MSATQSYAQQLSDVVSQLTNDIEACDFKWTLFVSAAQSYRFDSRLSPYPAQFISAKDKFDIDRILSLIAKVPTFQTLRKLLSQQADNSNAPADVIDLLYWVLCKSNDPCLKSVPKAQFGEVLQRVDSVVPGISPTHIFQVVSQPGSMAEVKFRRHAIERTTRYAFHGSKLDSFHSIIHHGLQQHLSKVALFGDGIYLSSEMHISLPFSPVSVGWEASRLGKEASCIAVCEFVDHVDHLKCHTQQDRRDSAVPEKYFVITNNEIVRLRYLLVFASSPAISPNQQSGTVGWLAANKAMLTMVFYVVLLAAIGLANSQHGVYFRHVFWQKISRYFDYASEDTYGHAVLT